MCRPVWEIYANKTPGTSGNFTPNISVCITKYADPELKVIEKLTEGQQY